MMKTLFRFIDMVQSKVNKKRRFVLLLVLLLLGSIVGFFVWAKYRSENPNLPPLTNEELELVGEWKLECPGPPIQKDYGYTLLPDHKCIKRWYYSNTDDIKEENENFLWWREGNRLTIRYRKGASRDFITIGPWTWTQNLDDDRIYDLTPAGPGQFNAAESVRIETVIDPPQASISGKMFRVERKND